MTLSNTNSTDATKAAAISEIWSAGMTQIPHWALYVATPDTTVTVNPSMVFSGASMIKTFIVTLISEDVAAGKYGWDSRIELAERHTAEGDGLFQAWMKPQMLTIHDTATMCLAMSDNTATNMLIDHLGGTAAVNRRLIGNGWKSTRLGAWVDGHDRDNTVGSPDKSLPTQRVLSLVTAEEHAACFDLLIADPACAAMLTHQQDHRSLARYVSHDLRFVHKSGTAYGVRHDGGVLELPGGRGNFSVHCLTDGTDRDEATDDPACLAMADCMKKTLALFGI